MRNRHRGGRTLAKTKLGVLLGEKRRARLHSCPSRRTQARQPIAGVSITNSQENRGNRRNPGKHKAEVHGNRTHRTPG